ncbi:MAG: TetR/AcrR family transcriptional regulator [Kofleriaceae bacterium]|nr:TetR/AcrR family transcriptional regulator [Myxococcales bacterium]MCB9564878.1 TetR/AcrR family transcriptional regulator [Kofleriaceae bacterium]MCB9573542.1 TetR/AcrR family transcriptional regulator [Kofleriaceae bacterium]
MTTPQDRKQQERQARRRRIQAAAREVFAERGYAKASIEQIAKQAGLSVGAIYLYFRSKEDLYVSLLEETLATLDGQLTELRGTTDVSTRLAATYDHLLAWAGSDVEGTRIIRLLSQPGVRPQLSDEVVTEVGAGITRLRDHLGASVADGIHAGVYRPVGAAEVADLVWALFLGNLDAAEARQNLELPAHPAADAARAALAMVESSLRQAQSFQAAA